MDSITIKSELTEAIEEDGGGTTADEYKTSEMRLFYEGNQAATVWITAVAVDDLIAKGQLRVGYNWCRITERTSVQQCYKFWKHGHEASKCKGTDRSKNCRNCGKEGHLKKECPNEKHCPLYSKGGHSVGTGVCPEFRSTLREAHRRTFNARKAGKYGENTKEVTLQPEHCPNVFKWPKQRR